MKYMYSRLSLVVKHADGTYQRGVVFTVTEVTQLHIKYIYQLKVSVTEKQAHTSVSC